MKKLIIVTGVSGTGKTALTEMLYRKIENSILLSYDKINENINDTVGFKNDEQKKSLRPLKKRIYKELIEECMKREDEVIILEKPFKIKWKNYFEKLSQKYEYQVYTINMFAKDFDTIWNRLLKREMSKEERHPSHYLHSYNIKEKAKYEPYFVYDYMKLKKEYDELVFNSINLGNVINIKDIETLNEEELIKRLMN